ncbi:uncharacterized protein LOC103962927 [Pyrus x bretschneideri]|uniref:uncharacterized protein LOC103962927 n=1 Tax=Pyrus x bretschneideri TaxID=225117 RepID=UPI00202F99ED|nr:uncharacterized protein LOC103962927 [Pyrus x bretschneideri]
MQLLIYFVGGRLPAVFYFTAAACPNTVTYSIPIVRKIREHFPHVKLYKVLITVESDLRPIAYDLAVCIFVSDSVPFVIIACS